ncbi:MAG TPA: hypothetical protein VNT58_03570 [Gaiellaceae bacterium]|nr:hypothetical protein [Gaiellaceae bacterium]
MTADYGAADFERAVAAVGAEPSPEALVRRLGLRWERLTWIAVDASAAILAQEGSAPEGRVVAYGSEAFAAGFLIGLHLPGAPEPVEPAAVARAVEEVQRRGRHAVIADACDLTSVAEIETLYAESLVESMELEERGPEAAAFVTRLFEIGLAVGLLVASDRGPQAEDA